jgi:hypothetical protein
MRDGPAGLRRTAGPSTSEGRGEAEIKNAKRMCRFGSGEVRRLDFLLRGHEGSTAKPSSLSRLRPPREKFKAHGRTQAAASPQPAGAFVMPSQVPLLQAM